jgi:hypothetical protein
MTWLLGFLVYAAAVALVLLLVGGVKRADALHSQAARNARKPAAPPAPRPVERPAVRVARIITGRG